MAKTDDFLRAITQALEAHRATIDTGECKSVSVIIHTRNGVVDKAVVRTEAEVQITIPRTAVRRGIA